MNAPTWLDIEAARVPEDSLVALAGLRRLPKLTVRTAGDGTAWLRFPAGNEEVLLALRPIIGAKFFANRQGEWFPLGVRVPTAEKPPESAGMPLDRYLMPGKVAIRAAGSQAFEKAPLRLVRSAEYRKASLLECSLDDLGSWIDGALTADIECLSATVCGDRILLRGKALPALSGGQRYAGERVFVPLGFRCEPDWPEEWLRDAAGIGEGEIFLLRESDGEIIGADTFSPATRAGLRLARQRGHIR